MMDMADATWQEKLDVLRVMYKKGELSAESAAKIRDKLDKAVDEELSKPAEFVSNAFVDACVELMGVLAGEAVCSYESHKKQNWQAIKKRIGKKDAVPLKRVLPAFGLAVILVAGVVIVDAIIPTGRISTYSTPDEQLYVVQGEANKVRLMPSAMASLSEGEVLNMVATDIGEVEAFFGFVPPMPKDLPSGWTLDQYEGHIAQSEWMFLMVLSNDAQDHTTTYQITASTTYDGFGMAYPQNGVGSKVKLSNGLEGYLTYNFDNILITWLDGLTCYDVSGPISPEEALKTIESIK